MGLILLADMMTWWNTHHESWFQLELVWHHVISRPSQIHNINLGWFVPQTWISEIVYKLYEAMLTTLTRLIIQSHWELMQFRALSERYNFNLSMNVYNFWLKFLVLFFFSCATSCILQRLHSF
jgi:hypothetical protein